MKFLRSISIAEEEETAKTVITLLNKENINKYSETSYLSRKSVVPGGTQSHTSHIPDKYPNH